MNNNASARVAWIVALSATLGTPVVHAQAQAEGWSITRIFGQPNAQQTNYNQVVPTRLFHPAGVLIDRMPDPQPSRLYVWDSGNNRILGFDHIGSCVGGPPQTTGIPCTENSMCGPGGRCQVDPDLAATIVLGQLESSDEGTPQPPSFITSPDLRGSRASRSRGCADFAAHARRAKSDR